MVPELHNPYGKLTGGRWAKGNLHSHTTATDGERELQAVIDDYAARGHEFLMISDHDVFTGPEVYGRCDSRAMTLIPGNEITANGPHLLHVGGTARIEPDANRQSVIDAVNADEGFAVFNHPNWQKGFSHCPQDVLEACSGYAGIEIYNGVISRLEGSPYATNRWDMLLSGGVRAWGFANDDSHKATGDTGWGWNTAYLFDDSVTGVVDALRRGRFYASTGVVIGTIVVDRMRVTIETENAARIVALADYGKRVGQVEALSMTVDVPEDATYLRFECWGHGESFAWSQPLFVVR